MNESHYNKLCNMTNNFNEMTETLNYDIFTCWDKDHCRTTFGTQSILRGTWYHKNIEDLSPP